MSDSQKPITDLEIVTAVRHYVERLAENRLNENEVNRLQAVEAHRAMNLVVERAYRNALIELDGRKATPDGQA